MFSVRVVMFASLILTACGGIDKPSPTINVAVTDFAFQPSALRVPAWQQISLVANNAGAVTDSFLIMRLGLEIIRHSTPSDQSNPCWKQAQIPPGQTVNASFAAPTEAGTHQSCRRDAALVPLEMAVARTFYRALWGRHGD